jgi:hypothetical protein
MESNQSQKSVEKGVQKDYKYSELTGKIMVLPKNRTRS